MTDEKEVGEVAAPDRADRPEAHPPAAVAELEQALEAARAEADNHRENYLRMAAELENVRKRAAREQANARRYGAERLAAELLQVRDTLELGLSAAAGDASVESLREGTEATLRLLEQVMAKSDITVVDPAGEPFDPEAHEAISAIASPTAAPNTVLEVVQKGYRLHDRLLRAAKVIVAKGP